MESNSISRRPVARTASLRPAALAEPAPPAANWKSTPVPPPRAPAKVTFTRTERNWPSALLALYVFLLMSRVVEAISEFTGANLRVTMILALALGLTALMTGTLLRAVRTPVVLLFGALTFWLLLSCVTSQWRGGSVRMIAGVWTTSLGVAVLIPSLVSSLEGCRKTCYALGLALAGAAAMSMIFQKEVLGRDEVAWGTLGNPNDLAFSLLLLMPFAVLVVRSESLLNWKSLVCLAAAAYSGLKILRTGSRAGLLAAFAAFLVLLLAGSLKAKIKMVAASVLICGIAVMFVPHDALMRYGLMFSGYSQDHPMSTEEQSAVESAQARRQLAVESAMMMIDHPLFGVGPGIFSAALAGQEKETGSTARLGWHEAHNSFTQMGAEAGFPALILYLSVIGFCLARSASTYRRARRDPNAALLRRMAGTMCIAMIIFAVCAFFGNYAYTFQLAVLAGLAQALDVVARKELAPAAAPQAPRMAAPQLPRPPAVPVSPQVPSYVRHRRLRDTRA